MYICHHRQAASATKLVLYLFFGNNVIMLCEIVFKEPPPTSTNLLEGKLRVFGHTKRDGKINACNYNIERDKFYFSSLFKNVYSDLQIIEVCVSTELKWWRAQHIGYAIFNSNFHFSGATDKYRASLHVTPFLHALQLPLFLYPFIIVIIIISLDFYLENIHRTEWKIITLFPTGQRRFDLIYRFDFFSGGVAWFLNTVSF